MLAVLIIAVIAWGGVLGWRRAEFQELSRHLREQAARYAQAERQHVDAVALVAGLERAIASAKPPAAGSDDGAWSAHREYVSDLQRMVKIAKARLDAYGGYRALHRHSERLAATYERAAMRPWLGIDCAATE